jgi:hypothetical protein
MPSDIERKPANADGSGKFNVTQNATGEYALDW